MTKRIRVVYGVNDFLVGGMQRQFIEQLAYFDRERFEIILVTLFSFPGERDFYELLPQDLEVHRLAFRGFADISSWWKLMRLLGALRPDIVVSSLYFSNTVFRLATPFFGYVSIAREHNTYIDKSAGHRFMDRVLSHASYAIVAVSRSVAAFTAKTEGIPASRFRVIHNGIDAGSLEAGLATLPAAPALKETMGFTAADRVLLAVSRLLPQKNHRLLIEGFARFYREHPEYRLAIVGEGGLQSELEAFAHASGAADAISFFGQRDDVAAFYKIADAYVSTSNIEGLSNAMLEALAAGLPLVSTRTAGTDELIEEGQNGFFIETATPDAVMESLGRFHRADRSSLATRAKATAARFAIAETVRKYEALFAEAVSR
jgi:glycosyltransferase involved in cell wall biosynthesis